MDGTTPRVALAVWVGLACCVSCTDLESSDTPYAQDSGAQADAPLRDGGGRSDDASPPADAKGAAQDVGADAARVDCLPPFVRTDPSPLGWASLNGGTTGGGTSPPRVVTTLAELSAALQGNSPAVVHVAGALGPGTFTVGSNKTIVGCAGGKAALRGHVSIRGSTNVILRNLQIIGYNCAPPDVDTARGDKCQNGQDAVTVEQKSKNIWIDHVAISDGSDGNLDIVRGSDFVTVSYTKFFYSWKRQDPNDTGVAGHRFSNLVGGSDGNASEDAGHLNVTWHHNWWAQNVVERAPRVRFGKNHLFNNLTTSTGNGYAVGLGVRASVLSENNVFVGVRTPINTTSFSDAASAAKLLGNVYVSGSGAAPRDVNASSVFVPPYRYPLARAAEVQADVEAHAGPQ